PPPLMFPRKTALERVGIAALQSESATRCLRSAYVPPDAQGDKCYWYWLYSGGIWFLRTSEALLMAAMKSSLSVLALLCFCLVSWTAAAQETDKRHPAAIAPNGARLTFQTLDSDTQQVGDLAHPRHLHQRRAAPCGRDRPRLSVATADVAVPVT